MYCSLVEYCTLLWNGTSRKNITALKTIQRSMTMLHYADIYIVQAIRVKIGQVCALLEEITIFYPDDQ